MKVSKNAITLLEFEEGRKNKQYLDSEGSPTIGIGHKLLPSEISSGIISISGASVYYKQGLTEVQIDSLCLQDLKSASAGVDKYVKVPLSQNQYDTLVEFTFNVGAGAFSKSTLLKKLNAGLYNEVPTQIARWVHDNNGGVVKGLVTRRNNEIKLWNTK